MLHSIIEAKSLGGYKLFIKFDDGKERIVGLTNRLHFTGIYQPLSDQIYFSKFKLNNDLGTIT
jgi:hypothetical protein